MKLNNIAKVFIVTATALSSQTISAETLGFLGPLGTYSDQATQAYMSRHSQTTKVEPQSSLSDVISAVSTGKTETALLPYYATISGFPLETWRNLTASHDPAIRITDEVELPVVSQLLAKPGTDLKNIKAIASHPNALKEASIYLKAHYTAIALKETASTAAAAKQVSEGDGTMAAVAGPAAGKLFGLTVVADNIQDDKNNSTNFWILRSSKGWQAPAKASTLVITLDVKPHTNTFNTLVNAIDNDGFSTELVHTSSVEGAIFSNRYVIVAKRAHAGAYVQTSHFLKSKSDSALLLGAY